MDKRMTKEQGIRFAGKHVRTSDLIMTFAARLADDASVTAECQNLLDAARRLKIVARKHFGGHCEMSADLVTAANALLGRSELADAVGREALASCALLDRSIVRLLQEPELSAHVLYKQELFV